MKTLQGFQHAASISTDAVIITILFKLLSKFHTKLLYNYNRQDTHSTNNQTHCTSDWLALLAGDSAFTLYKPLKTVFYRQSWTGSTSGVGMGGDLAPSWGMEKNFAHQIFNDPFLGKNFHFNAQNFS